MNIKAAAIPALAPSESTFDCGSGAIGASVDIGVEVAFRIGGRLGVGETEAELVGCENEPVFVCDSIVEGDAVRVVTTDPVGIEFTALDDTVLISGPRVSTFLLDTLVTKNTCRLTPSFNTSWQPRDTFAKASSCSAWSHPCDIHAEAV